MVRRLNISGGGLLLALLVASTVPARAQSGSATVVQAFVYGISNSGISTGSFVDFGACALGCAATFDLSGTRTDAGAGALSTLYAITPDGRYAVGKYGGGTWTPMVYSVPASPLSLVTPPVILPSGTVFGANVTGALAQGLSPDGSIVVGWESGSGLPYGQLAVQWYKVAGTWTEFALGHLNANDNSVATGATNVSHTIVGYDTWSPGGQAAWYTKNGGPLQALSSGGYIYSGASAISADGSTIVGLGWNGSGNPTRAVAWSGANYTTMVDLGTLGGNSSATAVNADGSIIVGNSNGVAMRWTATGGMKNFNTLLGNAGVDMSSISLLSVAGISGNGLYYAANSATNGYIVYYDGTIGGVTTPVGLQSSIDDLQRSRETIAIQQDAYAGLMIGDLDRQKPGYELGAFGLLGSAVGGTRGRAGWADNLTVTGGIAGGSGGYDTPSYRGFMGAAALRYDFLAPVGGWRPFAQLGGSIGELDDLGFKRTYSNGAGTATGSGSTSGHVASLFARLGVTEDLSPTDQVQVSAEIGERWLTTGAYGETLSSTNPFPATVAAGSDHMTIGKAAVAWSHGITKDLDFTARAALGTTLGGSSGLVATVSGVGTFQGAYQQANWAEAGLRIGYHATDRMTLDAYATGIAGRDVGTLGHVGAGIRLAF